MDEAALRLPDCLSPPALYIYLSLPEGVRSNCTQTVAALRKFWSAHPVFQILMIWMKVMVFQRKSRDVIPWKYSIPKSALLLHPLQMVILNDLIGWQNICCGKVCLLMLVLGLTNVMMIPSFLLIFIYSVGDCWMIHRRMTLWDLHSGGVLVVSIHSLRDLRLLTGERGALPKHSILVQCLLTGGRKIIHHFSQSKVLWLQPFRMVF